MLKPPALRPLPPIHAVAVNERKWQINPIAKPVPQSIWGQCKYSEDEDPVKKGNKAEKLLNGADVSKPLIMALSISPPEPFMPDETNKIVPFNVVKDMKQAVFERDRTPTFPQEKKSSDAWLPRKAPTTWKDVKIAWRNPENKPIDVVSKWAARMKYHRLIEGSVPENLIQQMLPASPAIAVGAGG
ncbi:hypothetical protein DL98DRAFT_639476 [Cadophora sp. DSE1049]|nr:hypothetical protein DL98DRAFT_639476 [Cadophora sp. DSE1049]